MCVVSRIGMWSWLRVEVGFQVGKWANPFRRDPRCYRVHIPGCSNTGNTVPTFWNHSSASPRSVAMTPGIRSHVAGCFNCSDKWNKALSVPDGGAGRRVWHPDFRPAPAAIQQVFLEVA